MDAEKPSVFGALVKWAHAEITRTCTAATVSAPATRFALLELACTLLATGCDASPSPLSESPAFPVLLASLALALDSMSRADGTRPSLRKAAITLTRRAIRNVSALAVPSNADCTSAQRSSCRCLQSWPIRRHRSPTPRSSASSSAWPSDCALEMATRSSSSARSVHAAVDSSSSRQSSILSFYTTQIASEKTGAASHSVVRASLAVRLLTVAALPRRVYPRFCHADRLDRHRHADAGPDARPSA